MQSKEDSLYDRQIRIWGHDAQRRMQNTTVFVFGINSLNCEVIKNLVLAGINVAIYDDDVVTLEDTVGQYFVNEADIGKNRAQASLSRIQELNMFCSVSICSQPFLDQIGDSGAIVIISAASMAVSDINHLAFSLSNTLVIVTFAADAVSSGYLVLANHFSDWSSHLPLTSSRITMPAMDAVVAGVLSQELLKHFTEKPMSSCKFLFQLSDFGGKITKITS